MKVRFTKAVASGNDFIIINNKNQEDKGLFENLSDFAKLICKRKFSIGADGLLLIESSDRADFKMRIFNPDGSEVSMCGNGIRCCALYTFKNRLSPAKMKIETPAGIIEAEVKSFSEEETLPHAQFSGLFIKVKMIDPYDIELGHNLGIGDSIVTIHKINTGVPHAVCFVESLDRYPVKEIGSRIRYHKFFSPEGTNVDFVELTGKDFITIRTYERGVEDETLACGSGVVASAVAAFLVEKIPSPVKVLTRSGETLKVYFKKEGTHIKDVFFEGLCRITYEGELEIEGG